MDILKFILSILSNSKDNSFVSLFNLLKENNFDLLKTAKNLKPENLNDLLKVIELFTQKKSAEKSADSMNNLNINLDNVFTPKNETRKSVGLSPISGIADNVIINSLNNYFS